MGFVTSNVNEYDTPACVRSCDQTVKRCMVACGTCRHVTCGPPSHFVVPLLQVPYSGTPDMAADLNRCAPLTPLGHEDDCTVRSIIPSVWLAFVNPEMISFGEHTTLGMSGTLVANDTVIELMQPECGVLCQNCMLATEETGTLQGGYASKKWSPGE